MKIEEISVQNFKCFTALDLPCAPLTLLTGYNGAGKSTLLQVILLLAQGLREGSNSRLLPLNGSLVKLGSGSDVISYDAPSQSLSLGVANTQERAVWRFENKEKDLSGRGILELEQVSYSISDETFESADGILSVEMSRSELVRALHDTTFVGAGRERTLETYPVPHSTALPRGDVGPSGEYAAYWYLEFADEEVPAARRHPRDSRETVRSQVDAWLDELFPGARVNASRLAPDAPVHLTFSLGKTSPWSKPTNVGYGLGYVFPILVALLTASQESILVIDSAEAHLHPRAQSAVGRLLAQMAGSGQQIFLESHSDHLLNGVRLAVRDGLLRPEDAVIHFFGASTQVSMVTTVSLDSDGSISDWPDGFFDQTESDLAALSGWT